MAYRILVDLKAQRLCVLYEVYWRRQDCSWREFNKDHDHDYEQIQLHFNLKTGKKEKVIISSVGPQRMQGMVSKFIAALLKRRPGMWHILLRLGNGSHGAVKLGK